MQLSPNKFFSLEEETVVEDDNLEETTRSASESPVLNKITSKTSIKDRGERKEKPLPRVVMESRDAGLRGEAESICAQRWVLHATCHEGMPQASQDQAAAGQIGSLQLLKAVKAKPLLQTTGSKGLLRR